MRRPINWVVVCLSLLFLMANLASGRRLTPPVVQLAAAPALGQIEFSRAVVAEPALPQFGYIRDDGSFLPLHDDAPKSPRLVGDAGVLISASPSWQ